MPLFREPSLVPLDRTGHLARAGGRYRVCSLGCHWGGWRDTVSDFRVAGKGRGCVNLICSVAGMEEDTVYFCLELCEALEDKLLEQHSSDGMLQGGLNVF